MFHVFITGTWVIIRLSRSQRYNLTNLGNKTTLWCDQYETKHKKQCTWFIGYNGLPARWALLLLWLPPVNYWKMIFIKKKWWIHMYYCKGMILCMSHCHVLYNLLEIKLLQMYWPEYRNSNNGESSGQCAKISTISGWHLRLRQICRSWWSKTLHVI